MLIDKQNRTVQFTRRDLMKGSAAVAGTLAAGKLLGPIAGDLIHPLPVSAATTPFIKGCDVSYLPQMEANGFRFKNTSGKQEDLFTILKDFDINCIRMRTWVNPSDNKTTGHCSTSETVALAKRVQAAGMKVMIDFHYGDTFNSVGKQNPPVAWANYDYTDMRKAVESYTYDFHHALKGAGVTADYVQHGNEINSGLLHPIGDVSKSTSQMTGLLMAGRTETLKFFPNAKCIIHLAQPQNLTSIYKMLDAYKANGGEWDITGLSSYATGSSVAGIITNMHTIQSKYGKPVMQVEFGESVSNPNGGKTDLSNYITGVRNFGGLGVFWWEPEVYPSFNPSDTSGAWNDSTEEPTSAMQGFYS